MKNCPRCGSMMSDGPEVCARCRPNTAAATEPPAAAPQTEKTRGSSWGVIILIFAAAFGACVYGAREISNSSWFMGKGLGDQSKGRLGSIRSALSIYYGDMEGVYPADLDALTVAGKYLDALPPAQVPGAHQPSNAVTLGKRPNDAGGWLYDNDPADMNFGTVRINCTHTDSEGKDWASF